MSMRSRRLGGAVLVAATLALAAPADASVEEATAIRRSIEHALASWRFREKITADDRVVVEDLGGRYRILIPGLVIEGGRPDSGGLDVGDVVIVAAPSADASWDVAVTLPQTMGIMDDRGILRAFVVIGEQRIEGRWVPAIQTFPELDARLGDVWVTEIGGASRAHLAALTLTSAVVERAPGLWDGPSALGLEGLELTIDEEGALRLATLALHTEARGMRLDDQARAFAEIGEKLGDEAGEAPAPVEPLVILRLAEKSALVFDAMTSEVSLTGLAFTPLAPEDAFALERASFGLDMEGLSERLARVRIHYEHDGLALGGADEFARDYAPEHVFFDLVADNVPAAEIRQSMVDYVASGDDEAGALAANRMTAAAMDAESEVRLNALRLEAPRFALASEGRFKSDRTAAQKVTGWIETTIRGLDGLLASLGALRGNAEAQQAAGLVMLLQSLGVTETDQTGAEVRRYRLEITPEGRMLLNGRDFAQVMGAAMAAPPQ